MIISIKDKRFSSVLYPIHTQEGDETRPSDVVVMGSRILLKGKRKGYEVDT